MNLGDALDDWPGQTNQPAWPGGTSNNPVWPGQSGGGSMFPGGPSGGQSGGGSMFPGGPSGGQSGGGGMFPPGPTPVPQQNLAIPCKQTLPRGVYDKLLFTISGTIKPNADKITIDIGNSTDLAFHFNPRFNEGGQQVIVRNSRIGGKWGQEERELKHFPFVRGQNFEIKILCTNADFKVAVNGGHLLAYRHRITNLSSINNISIYNDLTLSKFTMETNP